MAKCNPIIEEKGTINPTQLKVLRKWEAQMNSESLGDFSKRYFFALTLPFNSDPLQNSILEFVLLWRCEWFFFVAGQSVDDN